MQYVIVGPLGDRTQDSARYPYPALTTNGPRGLRGVAPSDCSRQRHYRLRSDHQRDRFDGRADATGAKGCRLL